MCVCSMMVEENEVSKADLLTLSLMVTIMAWPNIKIIRACVSVCVCVPLSLMVMIMTCSPLDYSVGHGRSSILMMPKMASLITFIYSCMAVTRFLLISPTYIRQWVYQWMSALRTPMCKILAWMTTSEALVEVSQPHHNMAHFWLRKLIIDRKIFKANSWMRAWQ